MNSKPTSASDAKADRQRTADEAGPAGLAESLRAADAQIQQLRQALQRADWQVSLLARSALLCRSGTLELSAPDTIVSCSAALRALLGWREGDDDGVGCRLADAPWIPEAERALLAHLWQGATVGQPFELEHGVVCADGGQLRVLHRGLLLAPERPGDTPVGIAILQDISERRDAERQLRELARYDELTGLFNRNHLLQRIDAWMHTARRQAGPSAPSVAFALWAVQVPRVAELAMTMGPAAADALATTMAARLRAHLGAEALLGHLGRGEFVWAQPQTPAGADAGWIKLQLRQQAEAVRQLLQQPLTLGGVEMTAPCRVGIARHPGDGDDAHALLGAAQRACRDTARSGGMALFEPQVHNLAIRALQMEAALRQALPRGELSLVYQPQCCLRDGQVLGAEALLRWQSAAWGEVDAGEFIPLAERSGLIVPIGEWVLREVCAQLARWRAQGLPPLRLAVNLSPVQFQLGDVASTIRNALREHGVPASALALELTEAALMHDADGVVHTLRSLRQDGIGIVLDDFGTGASSLSSLRRLPVELVKIDRSFIHDLASVPDSAAVCRGVIQLAHALNLPVLAEGVETSAQLGMLLAQGCDRLQGWLFCPPLPAEALADWLRSEPRLALPAPRQACERPRTLLLVDDEASILAALRRLFRRDGYQVLCAGSGAEGLELLAQHTVDVIVSDQRMPGMTGVEFLRRTKDLHPDTIRMSLSGYTDLQSIIDAVNEGAVYKFLTKPWDDERLRAHVAQAFVQKELADENRRLQAELAAALDAAGQVSPRAPAA